MACILTLMGSVLGCVTAIIALVLFQVPFLTALAIWSISGIACVAIGLALAAGPRPQADHNAAQELA